MKSLLLKCEDGYKLFAVSVTKEEINSKYRLLHTSGKIVLGRTTFDRKDVLGMVSSKSHLTISELRRWVEYGITYRRYGASKPYPWYRKYDTNGIILKSECPDKHYSTLNNLSGKVNIYDCWKTVLIALDNASYVIIVRKKS